MPILPSRGVSFIEFSLVFSPIRDQLAWTQLADDFLQAKAREWFGRQYKFYTDLGFEGFWNDMNEPAIFYSEYNTSRLGDKSCGDPLYRGGARLSDYKSFTHNVDGKTVSHWDVHNLFGAKMTEASSEGLEKLLDKRFLLFSRSS